MSSLNALCLPAPAKLNLFLHITGRRADGYHNLQTVFQLLDFGDTLTFALNGKQEITFTCNNSSLESPDNLVMQAARLLSDETGISLGTDITLDKRLPLGGGVGGGSSDAATTLLGPELGSGNCWLSALKLWRNLGLAAGRGCPCIRPGQVMPGLKMSVNRCSQVLDLPERWYLVLAPDCRGLHSGNFFPSAIDKEHLPHQNSRLSVSGQ